MTNLKDEYLNAKLKKYGHITISFCKKEDYELDEYLSERKDLEACWNEDVTLPVASVTYTKKK